MAIWYSPQGIELAVDPGDLHQVADLAVDAGTLAAAEAVIVTAAGDDDGHIVPFGGPAGDGGLVGTGQVVLAYVYAELRIDLGFAGGDRLAAHIDVVDKIVAHPIGGEKHAHGQQQCQQQREEHLRVQTCVGEIALNQSDSPFPRRYG